MRVWKCAAWWRGLLFFSHHQRKLPQHPPRRNGVAGGWGRCSVAAVAVRAALVNKTIDGNNLSLVVGLEKVRE